MSNYDLLIFLGSAFIVFQVRNLILTWRDKEKSHDD